jgi:hypothetical protein
MPDHCDFVNKFKADAQDDDGDELHWGFKEFDLTVEDCGIWKRLARGATHERT